MPDRGIPYPANGGLALGKGERLPSSIRVVLPFAVMVKAMIMLSMYSSASILHPICTEQAISLSSVLLLGVSFAIMRRYFRQDAAPTYPLFSIYFLWMFICCVRGVFAVDGYWSARALVTNGPTLFIPVLVYVFSLPEVTRQVLSVWFKVFIPVFFLFIFTLNPDFYASLLNPLLMLVPWLPLLPRRWRLVVLVMACVMVCISMGARSQILKALAALSLLAVYSGRELLKDCFYRRVRHALFLLPVLFLALGLGGVFNVLDIGSGAPGNPVEDDLLVDSRSIVFEEVAASSLKDGCILLGRTPAQGYETSFQMSMDDRQSYQVQRRRAWCEPVLLNIFAWTGVAGLVLYSGFYWQASYLAIYRSRNRWMKLLGVFVAFRWMWGWLEDTNFNLDIMNVSLWMMIAMCYSSRFRSMTDCELHEWVESIFRRRSSRPAPSVRIP